MNKSKVTGTVLAITAAAAFSMAPAVASAAKTSMVHCMGVNACKGNSSCKTAKNACKGQNSCKGQGFVSMTKEQCKQVGGKMK